MVQDSGTPARAGRIRPVNAPQPSVVQTGPNGAPAVVDGSEVTSLQARWRIDDEWWRSAPVHRSYFQVALANGNAVTLYHDLVSGAWYRQRYA